MDKEAATGNLCAAVDALGAGNSPADHMIDGSPGGGVNRGEGGGGGQPSRDPAGVLDTQEGGPEHGRSVLENLVQLFQLQRRRRRGG